MLCMFRCLVLCIACIVQERCVITLWLKKYSQHSALWSKVTMRPLYFYYGPYDCRSTIDKRGLYEEPMKAALHCITVARRDFNLGWGTACPVSCNSLQLNDAGNKTFYEINEKKTISRHQTSSINCIFFLPVSFISESKSPSERGHIPMHARSQRS